MARPAPPRPTSDTDGDPDRPDIVVRPVTPARVDDVHTLFASTRTTDGCSCMWFVQPASATDAGWRGGNRAGFAALARSSHHPMGVLAYQHDEPVGWCAAGPRARYARALRSTILRDRDPAEDPSVWLVTCFYVRRQARHQGITHELLDKAIELAQRAKAPAIEGFPIAAGARKSSAESFIGVEPLFAAHGFHVVARPSPTRVVMRRDLS